MSDKPFKIEEILDRMSEDACPGDVTHRYALKRKLLCSRYFDVACDRQESRSRFLAYTVPLFAGTMLVIVFSVAGTTILDTHTFSDVNPTIDTSHLISADHLSTITFLRSEEPARVDVAEYMDAHSSTIPLPDALQFVPMNPSVTYFVR